MAEVSITNSVETFTFQPGDIEDVKVDKTANLDVNETPGSDSASTFIVDFNGVGKKISISGNITAATTSRTSVTTTTSITAQIAWLEALLNGEQSGLVFNSTFQTPNKNVYASKLSYSEKAGNSNFAEFSMDFVEGGV